MRAYDHEQDQQSQEGEREGQGQGQGQELELERLEEECSLAKVAADVHEAAYQLRAVESAVRKLQREVEAKVGEAQLTETIALINAGIHSDPNIVKLLKTREESNAQEQSKLRLNASLFSRKLNQMSEALSMLLAGQKRLESRITGVEGELTMQLSEKAGNLQLQLEEVRGETSKTAMEITQRVELSAFELSDRMREVETKLNWKLTDFKSKIDEKMNQETVLAYLENVERKVATGMRDFQLASNIDPARLDALEAQLTQNRTAAEGQITQCKYQLKGMRQEIEGSLVRREEWAASRAAIEQRLSLFNDNFTDVYRRALRCEEQEQGMQGHITQLLKDATYSMGELKRINTVLLNIKISDDFQRMLEEMNPAKVLELQDSVDGVKAEQTNIFREIALARREISIVQAKSQNMGFLTPNRERDRLKKEELEQALSSFFTDNHFAQKIASIDRQLADYRHSVDSVALLSRQVARLQKESETHHLAFELRSLEEHVKRELALMATRIRERHTPLGPYSSVQERPGSNGSSILEDPLPLGEAALGRSFSSKKLSGLGLRQGSKQVGRQLIELKTSRR